MIGFVFSRSSTSVPTSFFSAPGCNLMRHFIDSTGRNRIIMPSHSLLRKCNLKRSELSMGLYSQDVSKAIPSSLLNGNSYDSYRFFNKDRTCAHSDYSYAYGNLTFVNDGGIHGWRLPTLSRMQVLM
jgi:hypothetical protein